MKPQKDPSPVARAREEREAAALRANLQRRKEQQRARAAQGDASPHEGKQSCP